MDTSLPKDPQFSKYYIKHCKYLKLKGLQPKTIEAYARALRRMGRYPFDKAAQNNQNPWYCNNWTGKSIIRGDQKIEL